MKLWTVQDRSFVDANVTMPLVADWENTPQDWRHLYLWMVQQWNSRIGIGEMKVPLWCWHSCRGVYESCPTAGTFSMLMGDWSYYSPQNVVLELQVPDEFPLLSSYSRWNDAMHDAIDRRAASVDSNQFEDMFQAPLFKHATDDIQAVIPHIERSWIINRWKLPKGEPVEPEWDLPCNEFPKEK